MLLLQTGARMRIGDEAAGADEAGGEVRQLLPYGAVEEELCKPRNTL